jgi:prevent-host-death family protein
MTAACRDAGLASPTLEEIGVRFRVTLWLEQVGVPAVDETEAAILADRRLRSRPWLHLIQCGLMGTREKRIGIRELKSTLSECVREVRAGRTIVVTDHGQPVARIIPEGVSLRERIEALKRAGTIAWSGRRLRPAKPAGKVRGAKTVADLVVENRE